MCYGQSTALVLTYKTSSALFLTKKRTETGRRSVCVEGRIARRWKDWPRSSHIEVLIQALHVSIGLCCRGGTCELTSEMQCRCASSLARTQLYITQHLECEVMGRNFKQEAPFVVMLPFVVAFSLSAMSPECSATPRMHSSTANYITSGLHFPQLMFLS